MKLNQNLFQQALEMLIEDFDGFATISDLGIVVNGTQIDHIAVFGCTDSDEFTISYFICDDPANIDGEYNEILLTAEQTNEVLQQFVDLM